MGYWRYEITLKELVPTRQLLTRAGALKYLGRPGLAVFLPYVVGTSVGVWAFGDVEER
jgi:hypothetical protein